MMKKEYIKPMIEMIDFQAKDTIMTNDEDAVVYGLGPGDIYGPDNSNIEWWD